MRELKLLKNLYFYESLSSTNEVAKELLRKDGVPDSFLVVADEQTSGKGRWGRSWWSPKGGLWCSLVMPPIDIPALRAAFSVVRTIKKVTPLRAGIKWPNDVLVRQKKVGGVLVEREKGKLIIGVGVNINQESFQKELSGATSLSLELGSSLSQQEFLYEFIADFELNMTNEHLIDSVRKQLLLLGERVTVKVKGDLKTGDFWDIDNDGALLFRESTGIIGKLTSSDVEFLRSR